MPNRLRAALEYRGMSVPDLVWATHIPDRTIRRWLGGVHEPRMSHVKILARALETDPNYLCSWTDEIEPGVIFRPGDDPPPDVSALGDVDAPPPSGPHNGGEPGRGQSPRRKPTPPDA